MMKSLLIAVCTGMLALSASASVDTVLTSDNIIYTVDSMETQRLQLTRRASDTISVLLVPGTEDPTTESDARLLWDAANASLIVVWNHHADGGDEILLARLSAAGWSEPLVVASSIHFQRVALQVELTRALIEGTTNAKATFVHAVWWTLDRAPTAEYALVAFEDGEHVSTYLDRLDSLMPVQEDAPEPDELSVAIHPPMVMGLAATGVDVVYGSQDSTSVRRVGLDPRRIAPNARAWRPVGRFGTSTGRSGFVSNSIPLEAAFNDQRIVLYTPGVQFRYMVYENGQWSPLRAIRLDESLKPEHLVEQLAK